MNVRYLKVNDMLFHLNDGEEITSITVGTEPDGEEFIVIEGFTPSCQFITSYYYDETVSKWRGFGRHDIWTESNCNIIHFDIIED
jgi:hypothetical protein